MRPRPRIRKTIKWGGLAAAVVLTGAWAASLRWSVQWGAAGGSGHVLTLMRGAVGHARAPAGPNPFAGWAVTDHAPGATAPAWPRWSRAKGQWAYEILPLWVPLSACALASAAAWRLDAIARRRARVGLCPECRYDRAGLAASAPCPECGRAG